MSQINIYLTFNGNCADAMRFYQQALGGDLQIMTFRDQPSPEHTPPGFEDKVMHAALTIDGELALMASDAPPQHASKMGGFAVSLTYNDADESQRAFDKLAAGGKITMPFGKTFWSDAFGMLEDKFGTPWMVNTAAKEAAHV